MCESSACGEHHTVDRTIDLKIHCLQNHMEEDGTSVHMHAARIALFSHTICYILYLVNHKEVL